MAQKFFDRVREQSFTTGTGPITLAGVEQGGFVTFASVLTAGDTFDYVIYNTAANEFEVGLGTLTNATTFARTTVYASSNAGNLVNFSPGTLSVGLVIAAGTWKSHHARHESGGDDAIKLDDLAAPDDNTDLDVTITKHGLTPKLPNDVTKFLNGLGGYTTPAGTGTHALLDGTVNNDTLAGAVVRGDLIVGNSTPKWARLPIGTVGKIIASDGVDAAWSNTINNGAGLISTFGSGGVSLSVTDGTRTCDLANGSLAMHATDGSRTVDLCSAASAFSISATGKAIVTDGGNLTVTLADVTNTRALRAVDGTRTCDLADGTVALHATGGGVTADLAGNGFAVNASGTSKFTDSTRTLDITDGTNAIKITGQFLHVSGNVGWFNVATVGQQAANQAMTDSTGGTPSTTLAAVSGTGDDTNINNNFSSVYTRLAEIRLLLTNYGLGT